MFVDALWRNFSLVLKLIMAVFMFAMMALTTIDVAGRYLFNTPLEGGFEIVSYLMAFIVFASLPVTTATDSHLSVSLLGGKLRGGGLRVYRVIIQAISAIALIVIALRIAAQGQLLSQSQQVSGYLSFPLAPIAWGMTFFATMAVVVVLIMLVRAIMGLEPRIEDPMAASEID